MKDFNSILSFIRSVFGETDHFIPLHAPVFFGNEKKYLEECIDSTFVSSVGKFVDDFEVEIARYTGAKKAVACVNGTCALHLALKLAGVKQGNEVITQPLTFIATANAITYCAADPIFLDVDLDTMGLSPKALQHFLENWTRLDTKTNNCVNKSTNKTISACLPMHTFGHPCKIDEIIDICTKFNITVVEDAAESLGSLYKGQHTGTFGKIGVLSFNGNKIITTGGGGMLLFHDEDLAKRAKHLTTQAKLSHPWEFIHDEIGYNYRMPNINAAIGLAQLEQIEDFIKSKRKLAEEYSIFFEKLNIPFCKEPLYARSNYWLNCILLKDKNERDVFLKITNENGIMTRPAWRLMDELPMYRNCQKDNLENAIELADRLTNIPSSVKKF
jgi:aminotransferase in exopolysaccharide biosynthesis